MRAGHVALADVLLGKARGALLGLLYGRSGQSFYYRQITRELSEVSAGTLQRELDTLSQLGLIKRSNVGNQVFYQANVQHPIFPELSALVAKTVGAFHMLRSALAPLASRISVAFVYGSMARGEEKPASDIDLMVIGRLKLEELVEGLDDAERSLGRSINPTLYSVAEFKSKLGSGNHFLSSVLRREKVFLIGDEDDLAKVGGVRLAQSRTNQPR